MSELIQPTEEKKLFDKLSAYYTKLFPGVVFKKEELTLKPEEIGEIIYTYPGAETEATFNEEVKMIEESLAYGYDAPLIIIRKGNEDILLDGHRRVKVAFTKKLPWKALALIPDREVSFGIEKMEMGKVKERFS